MEGAFDWVRKREASDGVGDADVAAGRCDGGDRDSDCVRDDRHDSPDGGVAPAHLVDSGCADDGIGTLNIFADGDDVGGGKVAGEGVGDRGVDTGVDGGEGGHGFHLLSFLRIFRSFLLGSFWIYILES